MSYQSIDEVQQYFAELIFNRTKDPKKSAGRALGTFVEIIAYYLLKSWGLQKYMSIETRLPEYGDEELTHNVEFTLHRLTSSTTFHVAQQQSLSSTAIVKKVGLESLPSFMKSSAKKIIDTSKCWTIKNGAIIGENEHHLFVTYIDTENNRGTCSQLEKQAFAMVECKRVGKEGDSKGPQTIEKAKQGAYVAKAVSSMQRVKTEEGILKGLILKNDGTYILDDYYRLLGRIASGDLRKLVDKFVITIGIVSNHGNWFTSDNPNKETKVLCQSYDWLLFLSDEGLTSFVRDILRMPYCREAFTYSYSIDATSGKKNNNIFTKSIIDYRADRELTAYFLRNVRNIEKWFNVLTPQRSSLNELQTLLSRLGE